MIMLGIKEIWWEGIPWICEGNKIELLWFILGEEWNGEIVFNVHKE